MGAERQRQTLFRTMAAPIGLGQILAAKVLGCWLAMLMVCPAFIGLGVALFRIDIGSPALLIVTMLFNSV